MNTQSKELIKKKYQTTSFPITSKRGIEQEFGKGKKSKEMFEKGQQLKKLQQDYIDSDYDVNLGQQLLLKIDEFNNDKKAWREEKEKKSNGIKASGIVIKSETSKAYEIQKNDKTFWIPKKWIREDGSLTPSGEKAYKDALTDKEKLEAQESKKKEWEEGIEIPENPDYESEKAFGFDLELDFYDIEKTKRERIFIPKSVIQDNGNIPSWILKKKIEEIEEKYTYSKYGGFSIINHPFKNYVLGNKDWSNIGE